MSFFQKLFKKKTRPADDVADFRTTIIRVDDNFISSSSIMLDEMLAGNIYSLNEINIAEAAVISGNITSRTAVISGRVTGNVLITEHLEIIKSAVISGKILAKSISIEAGAIINGSIRIEEKIDETDLLKKIENRLPVTAKDRKLIKSPEITADPVEDVREAPLEEDQMAGKPAEPDKRTIPPRAPHAGKPEEPTHNQPSGWY